MARIVISHSTYLEGLIPRLKKLAVVRSIKTIAPGVIKKTRGRSEKFKLRLSVEIENGFKIVARKGNLCQEVFVITDLEKDKFKKQLKEIE